MIICGVDIQFSISLACYEEKKKSTHNQPYPEPCVLNNPSVVVCVLNNPSVAVCVLNNPCVAACVLNNPSVAVCVLNNPSVAVCVSTGILSHLLCCCFQYVVSDVCLWSINSSK